MLDRRGLTGYQEHVDGGHCGGDVRGLLLRAAPSQLQREDARPEAFHQVRHLVRLAAAACANRVQGSSLGLRGV